MSGHCCPPMPLLIHARRDLAFLSDVFFVLMIRRPPRSTRTDTLLPYTTLFRSASTSVAANGWPPRCVSARSSTNIRRPPTPPKRWSAWWKAISRSDEHTSELQSLMRISYAVFCLKKTQQTEEKYAAKADEGKQCSTIHAIGADERQIAYLN